MADAILTEKTCSKCGKPFVVRCKPCAKAATAAWRVAHPGRAAAMVADWRARNPETAKARAAAYNVNHREEAKARTAAWYAANKDRAKEMMAAYRAANKDKIIEMQAAYRKANPDKVKARNAAWYSANSEKARADNLARYAANPEKAKALALAWAKNHPEEKRIHRQNRRTRKAGDRLSPGLVEKLFKLQRGLCACCGKPLGDNYHLDHRMPLALGGKNVDDNMQLLTQRCNNQKGAKHPVEFMQSRGLLL